jgi:2-polyprenyl-6-methoxyphenol hydroxylase-like FAD-dependent oxidoreductase
MLGDEATARVLPYTFLNFSFRYNAEQALKMDKMMHPIVDVALHPKPMYCGILLLDKPALDKPEDWVFYILATWPKEDHEYPADHNMVEELRRRMTDWADPYKSAVEWLPEDVKAKLVPFKIWGPTSGWDNHGGKITLAGDAAHAMTFRKSSRVE